MGVWAPKPAPRKRLVAARSFQTEIPEEKESTWIKNGSK